MNLVVELIIKGLRALRQVCAVQKEFIEATKTDECAWDAVALMFLVPFRCIWHHRESYLVLRASHARCTCGAAVPDGATECADKASDTHGVRLPLQPTYFLLLLVANVTVISAKKTGGGSEGGRELKLLGTRPQWPCRRPSREPKCRVRHLV